MASIRSAFLMIVIVTIQLHHAESQFSVLATNQVQIIRLLEEITTTSTPLVPNITALLTNQEALLHQIADTQTRMAASLEQIVTLLQTRQSEDVQVFPTDCSNISVADNHGSGVYTIDPRDGQGSFDVYCNMETAEGGWTVFQKRFDGSVDFFLNWTDYENGFGNLHGEHWLGLQQMHRLTSSGRWILRVDLEDFNGKIGYAQYEDFKIGDAFSFYQLSVGLFTGSTTDAMSGHNGQAFSTKDQDHDTVTTPDEYNGSCALRYQGAWWYTACHSSHLNGLYQGSSTVPNNPASLMVWRYFNNAIQYTPIKKSEMKILKMQ